MLRYVQLRRRHGRHATVIGNYGAVISRSVSFELTKQVARKKGERRG